MTALANKAVTACVLVLCLVFSAGCASEPTPTQTRIDKKALRAAVDEWYEEFTNGEPFDAPLCVVVYTNKGEWETLYAIIPASGSVEVAAGSIAGDLSGKLSEIVPSDKTGFIFAVYRDGRRKAEFNSFEKER